MARVYRYIDASGNKWLAAWRLPADLLDRIRPKARACAVVPCTQLVPTRVTSYERLRSHEGSLEWSQVCTRMREG